MKVWAPERDHEGVSSRAWPRRCLACDSDLSLARSANDNRAQSRFHGCKPLVCKVVWIHLYMTQWDELFDPLRRNWSYLTMCKRMILFNKIQFRWKKWSVIFCVGTELWEMVWRLWISYMTHEGRVWRWKYHCSCGDVDQCINGTRVHTV